MPKLKKTAVLPETMKVLSNQNYADLIPGEAFPWMSVLPKIHKVSQQFGYSRIETSPVESLDPIHKHLEAMDCPSDRFVNLESTTGRKYALRPQNFVSVLRAYMSHRVSEVERVTKWYYLEPVFFSDRSALTHLYEFGIMHFGEPSAVSDAQMISALNVLFEQFGFSKVVFEVNSKGCESCSPYFEEVLSRYLHENKYELCSNCQQLSAKESPRNAGCGDEGMGGVFNCPQAGCVSVMQGAPQVIDHLCPTCNRQLALLFEALDELEISYQLNPRLFGSQWLSGTVFRPNIEADAESGKWSLGVHGRRTRQVFRLTGQHIPIVSFSIPLNLLWQLAASKESTNRPDRTADVFLINLGELAAKRSLKLFLDLWRNGFAVAEHFGENGIKNQFKLAEKKGCPIALVIGQKEALEGTVILRDVLCGTQEVFSYDRIIEEVRKRLQE